MMKDNLASILPQKLVVTSDATSNEDSVYECDKKLSVIEDGLLATYELMLENGSKYVI